MASIEGGGDDGHKKGPGVKKAKKLSTRVDMTPMVDLGFLLITFFIFTATMSSPTTLDLNMPKDTTEDKQNEIKQSGALTIMPGGKDQVYYYEGELSQENASASFKQTTFKGIRDVIINKKKAVMAAHQHDASCDKDQQKAKAKKDPNWEKACLDRDLVVVIKPDPEATYRNTVDILDEMTINNVKRFAMVKIADTEKELIKLTEQSRK
jgi:biopolymer transport protein ExbD